MTRLAFIELIRRAIYNGQPSDDATITVGLVNAYLPFATAAAAKQNYKENLAIDGITYVNNSFYTTFKNLSVTKDENFRWKVELPSIPLGLGTSDGVEIMEFKDSSTGQISYPVAWLSQNQRSYQRGMRTVQNKILAYSEGKYIYALSTVLLSQYTASVTMVSAGDSSDLESEINIPDDYFNGIVDYMRAQFIMELSQPVDVTNDGLDARVTT